MTEEAYPTGSVVLVPFPDLSGRKRRPALVVSPEGFDDEDLVLCAITSRLPERFSDWEASLGAEDMVEEKLRRRSVVKVGKLFTMHHPHLWDALHRVHFSHEAGPAQLEDWRRAPKGSQEEIWAEHYDEAMGVLRMGLQ